MKIKELIARLQKIDPEKEIMILDGFNGGGAPRTINFGPVGRTIKAVDQEDSADCEEFELGTEVVVIGFGCY